MRNKTRHGLKLQQVYARIRVRRWQAEHRVRVQQTRLLHICQAHMRAALQAKVEEWRN